MSSGKYSALTGTLTRIEMLDTLADNISNFATSGFKKNQAVFESLLNQAQADTRAKGINFATIKKGFTNFEQGTLEKTGSPLHLAIQGEGFFKVESPAGDVLYTRQGLFKRSPEGFITTGDGYRLIGTDRRPIEIATPDVEIDERGIMLSADGEAKRIPIYSFPDDAQLERRGVARFELMTDHREEEVAEPAIYQGRLEKSNVNMMQEMTVMMNSQRTFEALQKVLMTYSKFGDKANEIGSIG